jgi:uridine kinase
VGIDGIDASGKTHLAGELAIILEIIGKPVIRVSLDSFHRSREERHRQGRASPLGYYEDSFDYPALLSDVLIPLGPGGDLCFRASHFNHVIDAKTDEPWQQAEPHSILLLDGVFLQRPELAGHWDFMIFMDCSFDTALERALRRDQELFGSVEDTRNLYLKRFLPGQRLYLERDQPMQRADVVLKNDDFENPSLLTR